MKLNRLSIASARTAAIAALIGLGVASALAGPPKSKLTVSQAEAAALKKYKTGKVQGKTELENEEGKWQFAVMVKASGKLHEVMVNANTGKINSEEIVTAKEEAAEKKAEAAKAHKAMKK